MRRSRLWVSRAGFGTRQCGDPDGMNPDQQDDRSAAPVPEDARETTPAQRVEEDRLEHQAGDPDAPAAQQSGEDVADETTR